MSLSIKGEKPVSKYDIVATGLFFVMAAVTHPLTALFGGLFLFILGVTTLIFCERKRRPWLLGYFLIAALLSLLILSPWVYVFSHFNNKLPISSHATSAAMFYGGGFFPRSVDNILSRLSFVPLDLRSISKGKRDVSTPYLDAQITMPLIILIGVFIYIGRRGKSAIFCLSAYERAIIRGSAFMLILFFIVSVCPRISSWFGGFFDILQFPYRLTSYVNLSALVILIILAGCIVRANVNSKQVINVCLAFCIGISFSTLMLKLIHASAISSKSTRVNEQLWASLPFGSNRHLDELPWSFYGAESYSVEDGFVKGPSLGAVPVIHQNFNVLDGAHFGQVEGLTVNLTAPTLVITNVQPFPWNQIVVDDKTQLQSRIIAAEGREAVLLSQGIHHLQVLSRTDRYMEIFKYFIMGPAVGVDNGIFGHCH